ncbi:MAG: glycosyltransferase family 4 protein [bacterium]|nr:glycosyltransferase family 4 protein [bacterium]
MKFLFIANAAVGKGLSGSDRIFIELAKRWSASGNTVEIAVWEDGFTMCEREGLNESAQNVTFYKWFIGRATKFPFIINYIFRILSGIYYALTINYQFLSERESNTYIYSCSDFWQDAIPALIIKARYPHARLIGSFYLAAPNPFKGFYEGKKAQIPSLKGVTYYLQQLPIYALFKKYAYVVFVTSEPDAKRFTNTIVIRGGVNVEAAKRYTPTFSSENKKYDAIFLGRFHPQKGVLELLDIWAKVVSNKPDAKLIMLGDGPLMDAVISKKQMLHLENNVKLVGYLFDGEEKYNYYKNTKIAVHPAVYDSGGMAAAEAMAWGLPGISFDLEALKTYYPKGMSKIPFANYDAFAQEILSLMSDKEKYSTLAKDARDLVLNEWDWDKRAEQIINKL